MSFEFSVQRLRDHWFGELGCEESDLTKNGLIVMPHGTSLVGYAGYLFFKHRHLCVASVPAAELADVHARLDGLAIEQVFCVESLQELFADRIARIIGPAQILQIRQASFRACHGEESRVLATEDTPELRRLLAECAPLEAEHSALHEGLPCLVGVFRDQNLVAAAGYEILGGSVAHIGALSAPAERGRGFASQAISLATEQAFVAKLGIQYQTLQSNGPALAAARRMGYEDFAETLALRLASG
jgi:hypothetical protein